MKLQYSTGLNWLALDRGKSAALLFDSRLLPCIYSMLLESIGGFTLWFFGVFGAFLGIFLAVFFSGFP